MMGNRITLAAEELANAATHGLGLVATLAGFPFLVLFALRAHDLGVTVGVIVFAATLIAAYGASTIYHATPLGPRKDVWMRLDQAAIYLLIAGTYTPFALGALRGPWGWSLLTIVWLAAFTGIVLKLRLRFDVLKVETMIYLGMGWLALVVFQPLLRHIGWAGMAWLFGGGVAYSVGTIFLLRQKRLRFGHCAWHVFALIGTACHITAVINYGVMVPR